MKRKVTKLRPSPNEEAQLLREEHERRRKLRIQQVREQQRNIALQIRREVKQRRQRELEHLEEHLREDWERQQREKLHTLQRLYQEGLQMLGQGHRSAKENEPDLAAIAQREAESNAKAKERYQEAVKELKSQRLKDHERQNFSINARKKALQVEKERSAKMASLPPPPPNPIQNIDRKKPHIVKKSDVNAFAATHYHMPETTVDRQLDTKQPSAIEEAKVEVRRQQELQREAERERQEQLEKARLRGKQALRREQLMQDRERFLVELEHMQQMDLLRRRQQVSYMPPQIFQPLYKRQEMREDFQREMEFAFEDMYTGERRVKGDLVLQLVPEPLPAPSTGSQDQDLDITLDDVVTQQTESTQYGTERETGSTEQETSAQAEFSRPAPRWALKKLLDRIRSQRNQWSSHGGLDTARVPPAVQLSDQIPERDTTIDTGSLASEEREKPSPAKLPEPPKSPPALETTEDSIVADKLFPDVLSRRIQEFEDEQKKKEEELEREKQQQVALLQELEEQKEKLEQMLLEAQQERENLKAAVTQQAAATQPEVPVHEQEGASVTPGSATELAPPASEDDHTGRIREYQQRLLEQNRIHKRSVEVARQRLKEYQRALQIRYNMTATSLLPPAAPPGLVHPPVPCPESPLALQPPLQIPTSSTIPAYIHGAHAKPQIPVEIPTRQSHFVAPVPHHLDSVRSLPVQLESFSGILRTQSPDVSAWLADSIMERVTEHLPERLRPSMVAIDPLSCGSSTMHQSTSNIPLQPSSDPTISPCITDCTPVPPDQAAVKPGTLLHGSVEVVSPFCREDERQRQELQDIQRRLLEQREAVTRQQRRQEEERRRREEEQQRQEEEREQMRRQREALQALIATDAQPPPETASDMLVSEDIAETRQKLLASLLRAIEESNGGTLSHLEDDREQDSTDHQQPSVSDPTAAQSNTGFRPAPVSQLPSGLHLHPRAPKPPVTRVRLGVMEMTEQHELSAIQEVETPFNRSLLTGPEDAVKVLPQTVATALQEESSSVASDVTLYTPSVSSGEQQTAESASSSGTSSSSSQPQWRERLLTGAGTSPESLQSDPVLRIITPPSSDSGRGEDFSGPAQTSYRSPTESPHRPPDPEYFSSTSISTGSYITTDPEQNSSHTDKSPTQFVEQKGAADLLDVSSPPGNASSAADHPGLNVESLFHDSSIQSIIDRYTRELNVSLSTAGKSTAFESREDSYVEEPGSSGSQQSSGRALERSREEQSPAETQTLPSDTAGAQRHGLEWDNPVNTAMQHFSDEVSSLAEDQGQDSFRPLIGQLADQSSVSFAADSRDLAMEQLVGQPSAHSSMIGRFPRQPVSVSTDQDGWESTLSHMIGQLSPQPSSPWLSGSQDFHTSQLIGQMEAEQSTTWLDEGQEESRMRPLVGELDNSAGQQSGSSGERTSADIGVSTEAAVPLCPVFTPQAQSHDISFHATTSDPLDQTIQNPTSPPERSEVLPASDSFHPLLPEVTHNETADPSMTFHLPENEPPSSPEANGRQAECCFSTHAEQSDLTEASTYLSDASPECLRAEESFSCLPADTVLHESFCQLATSQCLPHESVLMASPDSQELVLATQSLTNLTLSDDTSTVIMLPPKGGDAEENCSSVSSNCLSDVEAKTHEESNLWSLVLLWDKIQKAASEKGILEQSEITLVSLTDTTLQDQEVTIDKEEEHGDKLDGMSEEDLKGQEELESTLLPEETAVALKEDKNQSHTAILLEFDCSPNRGLQETFQHKCRVLLQRSSRRVEEIKAKKAHIKAQSEVQGPSKAKESKANDPQPVKVRTKLKGEQAGDKTTEMCGFVTAGNSKPKKLQLPPTVGESRLKMLDEVKICTPEQRKRDVSEMHHRTRRLYEQLEEVRHQREMRSRQEAYAKNRLKAKEFHKKTLQRLRAKQM
ncbi:hypothetical protein LDENG_00111830 [Lucifuga dentata]|nr:hypothetical protein LDENG_00111830 [Lucifuga dentata]